jgi:hypothetical protein
MSQEEKEGQWCQDNNLPPPPTKEELIAEYKRQIRRCPEDKAFQYERLD